ncbi:small GTP-binding domain protein (macronuclear) [Tetrahymena thermophila SB210]|uniref:Small GTP-binding domain protein n=1 Tax=Tetrahymena thermophila (strain SB210) TaxID=312017 RepID=Q23LQ2_TETTS|nr:small GTP-binding domain protein [Tetrahymena thermophila SB210]EAR97458.2 small GTP-binding domain protein [Tetrahymena thermophila SB210]|eukprot:XP_001017703.2 small GTP-binding domain protein [Tetrahymena thermophila SB210]
MKKVNSFIIISLVLLVIGQTLAKSKKKVIVIGHTGSGKSTFCNFLCSSSKFKAEASSDSVTQIFQTEQIELKDFSLLVTDTPGFTDPKKQNNWKILSDIVEFVKKEQVDFVVIVINYSIRAQNEEYILKWLRYTLPLNKYNSLILVNHYRKIQNFCSYEDEDENENEDQCLEQNQTDPQLSKSEENNKNFMNFIKNTFTNSTIEKISYNTKMYLTGKEFRILIKRLKEKHLPLAQLDHTKVYDLQNKIEIELYKNEGFCFSKYKIPQEEKNQRKMVKLEQEVMELKAEQKTLQNLVDSINHDINNIIDNPREKITTGFLWWTTTYTFHSTIQINQMNRLQDDKSNTRIQILSQQMIEQKIKEKLEKLEEESESLVQKIPELKEFKQCLHSANQEIQEMVEVKNYFEALNSLSKQKQQQQQQ